MENSSKNKTSVHSGQNQESRNQRPASAAQSELSEVCARFADVCDYFSRKNMDLPPQVLEEIGRVSRLSIPERIIRMNQLNRDLMEYLHATDQSSGTQQ